jgi:hypothetical protein
MELTVKYIVILHTSQRRGERKLAYRMAYNIRSGLPRSIRTLPTPNKRIKTVVSSEARLMGLRHSALRTRRTAEINVPAWLIPMKKTKLVI